LGGKRMYGTKIQAGIYAWPSAASPTEIVYHPIPLPQIRLPYCPRDDCLGTITKPDVGMTDSAVTR